MTTRAKHATTPDVAEEPTVEPPAAPEGSAVDSDADASSQPSSGPPTDPPASEPTAAEIAAAAVAETATPDPCNTCNGPSVLTVSEPWLSEDQHYCARHIPVQYRRQRRV